MSKSIELCSRHQGPVGVLIRNEQRTVVFEAKKGVGVALCDADEVEKFLSISKTDYWVSGRKANAHEDREIALPPPVPVVPEEVPDTSLDEVSAEEEFPSETGGEEPEAAPEPEVEPETAPLTLALYEQLTSVKKLAPHLAVTTDQRVLMEVIAAEATRPETRDTWMKALNTRLDVLQKDGE